eukprot:16493-Heterococcus_DN1.PRE.5
MLVLVPAASYSLCNMRFAALIMFCSFIHYATACATAFVAPGAKMSMSTDTGVSRRQAIQQAGAATAAATAFTFFTAPQAAK